MQLPLCIFNRHTPVRNRTKWDGLHYISTCHFCGKPIRRLDKKRWKLEWLDAEGRSLSASSGAKPRPAPSSGHQLSHQSGHPGDEETPSPAD